MMKTKALTMLLSACLIVIMTACGQVAETSGSTEDGHVAAKLEGTEFVKADTVTDMKMILDNNPDKTNIAKVWFDNYRIFDSDETHAAKNGYEWRSVDMHIAVGDDSEYKTWTSCHESNFVGEYYQDNDWENDGKTVTVNFNGKDYTCEQEFTVLNEERDVSRPDYKKYGWSGEGVCIFEYNEAFLVPKGFDGMIVGFYDTTEYELKNRDFDALEHIVYFRLD